MGAPAVDDKASDTLVVVSGEGFWTGSSTLPHLHQLDPGDEARLVTVGLPIAMAGNAVLCLLGAGALIAFGRSRDQVTGVRAPAA